MSSRWPWSSSGCGNFTGVFAGRRHAGNRDVNSADNSENELGHNAGGNVAEHQADDVADDIGRPSGDPRRMDAPHVMTAVFAGFRNPAHRAHELGYND